MISIYRKNFIVSQLFFFICAFIYALFVNNTKVPNAFILIYSVWNIISYLWIFFKEMKYAPDFHPYQFLLLSGIQFIGFNGLDMYFKLEASEVIQFGIYTINDLIYLGILFLSAQHIIIFGVFYFLEERYTDSDYNYSISDKIINYDRNYYKFAIRIYIFVWSLRLIALFFPLASISSILVNITTYGQLLTLFLLVFSDAKGETPNAIKLHWIIVVLEIFIVLGNGMKEDIIRNLLPYCVSFVILYKGGYKTVNTRVVFKFIAIASFIVLFVFPYVSILRTLSSQKHVTWKEMSLTEVLSEYSKYMLNEGEYAYDDDDRSVGYIMSRAGSIGSNAWTIDYTQNHGTVPQYFYYNLTAVIPRIIWPSKPQIVTGGMVANLIRGESNWLNPNNVYEGSGSFSLGFIGPCYLCFGPFGAFIVVFLLACFLWFVWHTIKESITYNIISLWTFISMIFIIMKDFESFQDCGIIYVTTNIVYLIMIHYYNKRLSYD